MMKYTIDNHKANFRSNTYMNRKTHSKSKTYPSMKLQIDIMTEINESALFLYNYYVRRSGEPTVDLVNDTQIAKNIGWTMRKVKDNRLKLVNANYIHFAVSKVKGVEHRVWCFGKDKVASFKLHANDSIQISEVLSDDHTQISAVRNTNDC